MTQLPELPALPDQADGPTVLRWLEQALELFNIPYQALTDTAASSLPNDLHQLLPTLLPERRLQLLANPFIPHRVRPEDHYFADIWQRFADIAKISLHGLQQHWTSFEQGQLEVRFTYQQQPFQYHYNLNNFDLEPDLHQFSDQQLDEQLYGCSRDEEEQLFVLLPESLIEQLRAYRSPHWWRVR